MRTIMFFAVVMVMILSCSAQIRVKKSLTDFKISPTPRLSPVGVGLTLRSIMGRKTNPFLTKKRNYSLIRAFEQFRVAKNAENYRAERNKNRNYIKEDGSTIRLHWFSAGKFRLNGQVMVYDENTGEFQRKDYAGTGKWAVTEMSKLFDSVFPLSDAHEIPKKEFGVVPLQGDCKVGVSAANGLSGRLFVSMVGPCPSGILGAVGFYSRVKEEQKVLEVLRASHMVETGKALDAMAREKAAELHKEMEVQMRQRKFDNKVKNWKREGVYLFSKGEKRIKMDFYEAGKFRIEGSVPSLKKGDVEILRSKGEWHLGVTRKTEMYGDNTYEYGSVRLSRRCGLKLSMWHDVSRLMVEFSPTCPRALHRASGTYLAPNFKKGSSSEKKAYMREMERIRTEKMKRDRQNAAMVRKIEKDDAEERKRFAGSALLQWSGATLFLAAMAVLTL